MPNQDNARVGNKAERAFSNYVKKSYDLLISDEADKLLDPETVNLAAINSVEQSGIVFLDEIDKVLNNLNIK